MNRDEIEAALERQRSQDRPALHVLGSDPPPPARLGLVPGSFDPMTIAHAALAGALRERGCDVVVLVLSARTLPKEEHRGRTPSAPLLDPADRVATLLAYAHRRAWLRVAISSHGLLVDQAEAAARAFGAAEILLGIGSDKLIQLADPSWYEDPDAALARLFSSVEVAYAMRSGDERDVARIAPVLEHAGARLVRLDLSGDLADVSARAVRSDLVLEHVPPEIRPFLRMR